MSDLVDLEKGGSGDLPHNKEVDIKCVKINTPNSPGMESTSTDCNKSWVSSPTLVTAKDHQTKPWSRFIQIFKSKPPQPNNPKMKDEETPNQEELGVRQIHKMPRGYPKLATFLDSDDNFMIYRRFGYLQSRILLEKQDNLRRLEDELDMMDRNDNKLDQSQSKIRLMTRDDLDEDFQRERAVVLKDIEREFGEYATLLQTAQQMTAMSKPSSTEYHSVRKWMNNVKPVYDPEARFINHREDLVTLRPGREHAWLDAGIERVLRWCHCHFIEYLFRTKETRLKSDGLDGTVLYTRSRIENLTVSIITTMILVLLVLPIYLLYHETTGPENDHANIVCIGVLLVFTLAFSACISLFTRAKRHEILAASAGYCAVLVVFIGNIHGPNSSNSGSILS